MNETGQEKLQNLMRQLLILIGDMNELEKTFSRLRNETNELYNSVNNKLNSGEQK